MATIDTEKVSYSLRNKAINIENRSILITNFHGSEQEKDLTDPANCDGFGRVRHFKLVPGGNWPINPLPILPAAKALGIKAGEQIRAQVFQNAACNWRCWYCFVDFKLLNADKRHADFLTCDQMLDLYLNEENPPLMIDLTGGQPDLTPEWVPWMMEALIRRGLQDKVFLWSDDNLSNDYLWQYLTNTQIELISSYKKYSRVCCFKGIDEKSFEVNTKAAPELFSNQIEIFKKLLDLRIDLYSYITLTANTNTDFKTAIPKFLDNIQNVNENYPLRIVPLQIFEFTPMKSRIKELESDLMKGQYLAIEVWMKELQRRFDSSELDKPITEIVLYKN